MFLLTFGDATVVVRLDLVYELIDWNNNAVSVTIKCAVKDSYMNQPCNGLVMSNAPDVTSNEGADVS